MATGNDKEALDRPTLTSWAHSDEKQVVVGAESAPEVYAQPGLIPVTDDLKPPHNAESPVSPDGYVHNIHGLVAKDNHFSTTSPETPHGGSGNHLASGTTVTTSVKSKRKKWIWIGCVAAICTIIAAVVGGVVGSKSGNTDHDAGPPRPSTPSPTNAPAAVRQKSRLAVTGWKSEQSDNIRLFYQDTEGLIRYSTFSSISRGGWSNSTVLGVDAGPGTPLAACSFVARDPVSVRGCQFVDVEHPTEYCPGPDRTLLRRQVLNPQGPILPTL